MEFSCSLDCLDTCFAVSEGELSPAYQLDDCNILCMPGVRRPYKALSQAHCLEPRADAPRNTQAEGPALMKKHQSGAVS